MKKIFSLIVLLAGVISFTSCGEDDATYTPVLPLEIASNDVYFEAAGGTGSIVVNATGTVTAETTSDWITLSVNGKTVTVTAKENTALDGRSARIVLIADGATTNVTAIQTGLIYQLENCLSNYTVESGASTLKISVVSSASVAVNSLVGWITAAYNAEDSEITLNIAANMTPEDREGQVAIEVGGLKDTLTIRQNRFIYELVGSHDYTVESDASTLKVNVNVSSPLTVKSLADWMKATATYNAGNAVITVNITANTASEERVGQVAIEVGEIKDTLTITQNGQIEEEPQPGGKDITGEYLLLFTEEPDAEEMYYVNATLTSTSLDYELFQNFPFSLPVVIDEAKSTVTVASGSHLGTLNVSGYGIIPAYLGFLDSEANLWTGPGNTSMTMTATLVEDEGDLIGIFEGQYSTYTWDGWCVAVCEREPFSQGTYLGLITSGNIYNIILLKEGDAAGARSRGAYRNAKPYKVKELPRVAPFK